MEEIFDGFSEDITKWEIIREMIDLDLDGELQNEFLKKDPRVQLLHRQDVILYGTIPKMEQKIYTKCKECRLVFNPRDILSHKTCSGKVHLSTTPQGLKKKIKSKGSASKKLHSSLPPPPLFKKPPSPLTVVSSASVSESKSSLARVSAKSPKLSTVSPISSTHTVTSTSSKLETRLSSSSSHTSKASSINSPKSPSKSALSSVHSPKSSKTASSSDTIASGSVSSSSSSSSTSRYKKSRKSNSSTKVTKEFDPDVHCGVVEGSRGPCTRSITCSNHRIQLRKLVPGRSKDIHQLIAERKAAKEKELKHGASSGSYMSPNGSEEKDVFQNTSYVPIVANIVSTIESSPTTTYVPIMPKTTTSSTSRSTTTSIITAKQVNLTDMEKSTKTLDGGYTTNIHNNSQDSAIGTVPVVYMPMSPISFVQIGKNMICLESPQSAMSPPLTTNQSVFLTIPSQGSNKQSNLKMYKFHPKPVAIPSYGAKKVGGAILLSNQRVECQRNNIIMAMNKTNCKRPAVDKINSVSDSKQLRLSPNVNGFILHSDISETADAPQSNNCIQDKIALLNMK